MATTASVGIAFTADPTETADDLLRHADAAMYAAKELGRDRIEVFDETLRAKVRRRLQNEIELRQALEHGELVVHYQPEIEVPSGAHRRGRGAGALAPPRPGAAGRGRVHRSGRGDRAHHSSIGLWVLREACTQQVRWRREYPDHAHADAGQPVGPSSWASPTCCRR